MENAIVRSNDDSLNVFGAGFEMAQRMGKLLASSGVVPTMYQGSVPNCLIALDIANRIGMGVLAVMQSMYVVHGKPAFEAKFVAAAVNACGHYTKLKARCNGLSGDDYGYYAVATEKATGEELIGTMIDWHMVKAEGWDQNKKTQVSKWKTMPEQMFKYRAMSFWKNEFEPGITMGVMTVDEVEDITIDIEPAEVKPQTMDTVIESNKAKTNTASEDIRKAKQAAAIKDAGAREATRIEVVAMARELWGDDAMQKLGALFREDETSYSDAGLAEFKKMRDEIGDRLAVLAEERESNE